jgi:hypothetical protein
MNTTISSKKRKVCAKVTKVDSTGSEEGMHDLNLNSKIHYLCELGQVP